MEPKIVYKNIMDFTKFKDIKVGTYFTLMGVVFSKVSNCEVLEWKWNNRSGLWIAIRIAMIHTESECREIKKLKHPARPEGGYFGLLPNLTWFTAVYFPDCLCMKLDQETALVYNPGFRKKEPMGHFDPVTRVTTELVKIPGE